jgi:hypothetical protein
MKSPKQKLLRKRILEACINKQQVLIEDFTGRIKNILSHEGLGNEDEYDNTELAQDSQRFAEVNALNQSLTFATSDMNVLRYLSTLSDTVHTTPQRGAIVITNHGKYFISISAGQVKVDDDIFTTLSTNSQLFKMMKGKLAGESFEFNRMKYRIEEIF